VQEARRRALSDQGYDASRAAQGVVDCLMGRGLPTAPLPPRAATHAAQGVMDCLVGCGLPTAPLSPGGRQ